IVEITIWEDSRPFENDTTPENANFAFNLHYKHNYQLTFSKEGYFSKKLEVSTFNVPEEEKDLGFEYRLNITLYRKVDGVDASILDKPVGKIAFDKHYVNFEYDEKYMRQIQPKLMELQSKINRILRAQELAEQQYKEAIQRGDKAFRSGSFNSAKTAFTKASGIKPDEAYPMEMLAKVEIELKKQAEEQARLNAINEKYQTIIGLADQSFSDKEYEAAKLKYGEALQVKPDEKYPKTKLGEIDRILNALATAEEKQRMRDEKYAEAVKQADQAFFIKQYRTARNYYQSASQIKPEEAYPKNKIEEVNELMRELAASKALDDKYNAAISVADRSFRQEKYEKAMTAYQEATEIKPEAQYPLEQLKKIDGIFKEMARANEIEQRYTAKIEMADKAFEAKNYETARTAYLEASGIKPSATYPKNRILELDALLKEIADKAQLERDYGKYIAKADAFFNSSDFENARNAYQQASNLKPAAAYPKERIAEVDKKMREQENNRALKARYKKLIAQADEAFSAENFSDARVFYQSAAGIFPEQEYPTAQLALINKMMGDKARALENEKNYKTLISKADRVFEMKNYSEAKSQYKKALSIKPEEPYPKDQIALIDSTIAVLNARAIEINAAYQKAITSADSAFDLKDYQTAKQQYKAAVELKQREAYPRNRLNEVNKLLYLASAGKQGQQTKPKQVQVPADYSNMEVFKNELAKNYPQGITEEVSQEKGRIITRRILVKGNKGDEYKFIKYNWGGKYYFKNGRAITELLWRQETAQ
ncbi:MAG: hypothetical protein ACE5DN_03070, partial [Flavobacteriales bacterium]